MNLGELQPQQEEAIQVYDGMFGDLAALLKEGQRRSVAWKRCWQTYCTHFGGGTNDPTKHSEEFCMEFMTFVAESGEHMVGGPVPGLPKRKSPDADGDVYNAAAASGDWEQMVNAVKAFQRQGPGNKEIWGSFCDTACNGTRDPQRHDVSSLHTFLTQYAVMGGYDHGPPAKRINLGGGACSGGGGKEWLVSQVKAFQRQGPPYQEAWAIFCDGQCGGTRDPGRHDARSLEAFLTEQGLMNTGSNLPVDPATAAWHQQMHHMQVSNPQYKSGWGVPSGPSPSGKSKAQLVMHVKAFQRQSPENKEVWGSFCDTMYGGTRDPNMHDAATLEAFLSQYASGFVIEPDGRTHLGTGDPVKDELVAKVKAYQRAGEQQKETWALYAEAQQGGFRDPARHGVAILEHFVNVYGL